MHVPRTDGTERLKPFSRQFFQWHYIDSYTLRTVEELFLRLFSYLLCTVMAFLAMQRELLAQCRDMFH